MTAAGKSGPETSPRADQSDDTNASNDHQSGVDPRSWAGRLKAWRESIRNHRTANRIYRVMVAIVGGAIVIGGVALIPLPGPGWVIIFFGLALLATEFVWAARLQTFARAQLKTWTDWLGRQPMFVRVGFGVLTFILVVAIIYGLLVVTGVPGWIPDSWVPDLPGL